MRQTICRFFVSFTLIAGFAAAPAFSQSYGRGQSYDRPYGDRDRAREDRALFDRTRMDLDRASNYPYASKADQKRFDEARRDLFDFASRFNQGRYERHELDHAIDRIDHVVRENSLDPRDLGALEDDLRRMRDYRQYRSHVS
jgi:hypothetical protein